MAVTMRAVPALVLSAACTLAASFAALGLPDAAEPPRGVVAPLSPSSNPQHDAKVALGRKLFFDARLSTDGKVACATCHVAALAMTDGRARSVGVSGKMLPRNAPSLLNAALLPRLFWDGRVATLEEQARLPFLHPDEMGNDDEAEVEARIAAIPEYAPLFESAFGDRGPTLHRAARALAAFQRTLLSADAPFDRWWRGDDEAMSASAKRGYDLFIDKAGCAQCHTIRQSYALFTDGGFHVTGAGFGDGITDPGRGAVTKRPEDMHAFRTPPLRNVALTSPYMHDGSLGSLEDVVVFYEKGGGELAGKSRLLRKLDLSPAERADLIEFMKALTSSDLPQLEECDRLLADGRPHEAFAAFRNELEHRSGGDRALLGMARAAVATEDGAVLSDVEPRLRRRIAEASPAASKDGDPGVARLLVAWGRVSTFLSPHEDGMGLSREDDALRAWARVRSAPGADPALADEAADLEVGLLGRLARWDDAVALARSLGAAPGAPPAARLRLAKTLHRRGWTAFDARRAGDRDRKDLAEASAILDALAPEHLDDEGAVLRATGRHWIGERDAARTAYLAAARRDGAADRALRGLRSLLSADLPRYRADLADVLRDRPSSPPVLWLAGWEAFEQGQLDEAEPLLRRSVESSDLCAPHVFLARIAAKRNERRAALSHYAAALALDPRFPGLAAEYEALVRSRVLAGWDDVRALVDEYRTLLDAGPGDPSFQCRVRNNLAFILRDTAASWTSRGPARVHQFVEGAPQEARDTLRLSVKFYEEAAALVPGDADSLPFAERWVYAGVMNDLGLMLHYFPETRDLARAERCYLRAFDLTEGAYMDAYFYNLQFLYAFELEGRERGWMELARVAKDAILREDPKAPGGFAPDPMKRAAARRDWERLRAEHGE
ncbi:MAG: hypothetical protein HMLKMBBP_01707 [Planctomycetes bacterium]|nr:hypothetical protein [Planctomycetota bacterium]